MNKITGNGLPTKETVGAVGDIYTNLDDNVMYECIDIYPEDGIMVGKVPTTYTWRRLSNTETEFENRVGTGGSTGGAGGYKYFGITNGHIFKMDSIRVVSEPHKNSSNVTMAEFIEAYEAGPVMMVPVTYHSVDGMKPDVNYNGDGNNASKSVQPVIKFQIYSGTPQISMVANYDKTVIFAAE